LYIPLSRHGHFLNRYAKDDDTIIKVQTTNDGKHVAVLFSEYK